jgi:hypothetical protein
VRESDYDAPARSRSPSAPVAAAATSATTASDEAAAMNALAELDDPARRVSTAAEQASHAADKLEQAARRVEAAAVVTAQSSQARPVARPPLVDVPLMEELPPVRLRSRAVGIVSLLIVIGGAVAFYFVYQSQQAATAAQRVRDEQARRDADERTHQLRDAQADPGRITVTSTPSEASVWLKLGRTNLDTVVLPSSQMLRLRIERAGYQPVDTEVVAANWEGAGPTKKARVAVTLKAVPIDKKTRQPQLERDPGQLVTLPALPPNLPEQTGFTAGEGPVHIETSPPGAEVWLLIGFANTGVNFPTIAGRDYELRALADGYRPGYASITADEWRDPRGDPRAPIDVARKKATVEKHIDLEVDPDAARPTPRPGSAPKPRR